MLKRLKWIAQTEMKEFRLEKMEKISGTISGQNGFNKIQLR
jgi:hypothetical protein